jgi:ankyrin repeat protein
VDTTNVGFENSAAVVVASECGGDRECTNGTSNLSENDKALFSAAERGDVEAIVKLVALGGNVNKSNVLRQTPIFGAVFRGHADAVSALIACGASCNVANYNGTTLLHVAAEGGYVDIIDLLVCNGAEINAVDDRNHSCIYAAALSACAEDAVTKLVALGADINQGARDAATPMHNAAMWNRVHAIRLFASLGGNVNAQNQNGDTPLYLAAREGHSEALSVLIALDANVNIPRRNNETPLHVTIRCDTGRGVRALLSARADATLRGPFGSALSMARKISLDAELAALLLSAVRRQEANMLRDCVMALASLQLPICERF